MSDSDSGPDDIQAANVDFRRMVHEAARENFDAYEAFLRTEGVSDEQIERGRRVNERIFEAGVTWALENVLYITASQIGALGDAGPVISAMRDLRRVLNDIREDQTHRYDRNGSCQTE